MAVAPAPRGDWRRFIPVAAPAVGLLLILLGMFVIHAGSRAAYGDGVSRVVRTAMGPGRGLAAGLLHLRAGFARMHGNVDECLQLQRAAIALDPEDSAAVIQFALELAFDTPQTGEVGSVVSRGRAAAAIDLLHEAQALGNDDLRLVDLEARLLVERAAPAGHVDRTARARAVALALALAERVSAVHPAGSLRAAPLCAEAAVDAFRAGEFPRAKDLFAQALQHEQRLEGLHVLEAPKFVAAYGLARSICELFSAGQNDAPTRARVEDLARSGVLPDLVELARALLR